MLAKTMELGERIETDPALGRLSTSTSGRANDTEPKARAKHPRYPLPFAAESRADRPRGPVVRRGAGPAGHRAAVRPDRRDRRGATGEADELLERARNLRAVYNERLDVDAFIAILDWVHGGDAPTGRPRERGAHRDADVVARRGRPAGAPPLARRRSRRRRRSMR